MKILVVSDTHRNFSILNDIVDKNPDADLIIHLGDGENEARDIRDMHPEKPMIYVQGNCDYGMHKAKQVVTACGYKIYCCHGHNEDVHAGLDRLLAEARANECKIALYGHTHLYRSEKIDDIYVMNPGSPDSPRNHNVPTYGIIDISSNGDIQMRILEARGRE